MQSSRSLDRLSATFDDDHAVANAGLLLSATLAQHLGLKDLFNEHVDLGSMPGRANPGDKAMTLIASLIAGGECIDDADALRAGETDQVLGHWVAAPSTLGTFLRAFSFGHARQLDKVSGELLSRAWAADAGDKELTIDLDSTICETYGLQKQGGSKFTYNHVRGYHPLVSIAARTGDVIHTRLRGGPAHAGRGGASFVTETVTRARAAGATGKMMGKALHQAFSDIPEDQWAPIPYFLKGSALAEIAYTPFATKKDPLPVRLIVRRVPPTPGSQLALYTDYSYHAFITDRRGNMVELEADHRAHAEVENAIRDLKHGMGLNHMPSGRFGANAAWLAFNTTAHNLVRWVARIGLEETLVMTKTMRRRYFSMPGRITTSARKDMLHLPTNWPWATRFSAALAALRAISLPLRI